MATVEEIKQWGEENGWDVSGDRLPRGLRSAYDNRDSDEDDAGTPLFDRMSTAEFPVTLPELEIPDYDPGMDEIPPVVKPPTTAEKTRRFVDRVKRAAPAKAKVSRARKPRVSTSKIIALAWQGLAQMAAPINLPVARVLDMQAPVAGDILEDVVKDTVIDRLLQPIARAGQGGEAAWALVGPPLLVGIMTSKPEAAPMLVPVLKSALRSWIDIAGPKLEEVQRKDEEFQAKYGSRIDDMIEMFLMPAPSNDYSSNGVPVQ